jgi:sensor histidine kinase regulating citrate/malate metabolism
LQGRSPVAIAQQAFLEPRGVERPEPTLVKIEPCAQCPCGPPRDFLEKPSPRGTASAQRSVGLGLYIVKQVLDAHGASIEMTSTDADGTSLVVSLPRQP